jgi:hypothetical protein
MPREGSAIIRGLAITVFLYLSAPSDHTDITLRSTYQFGTNPALSLYDSGTSQLNAAAIWSTGVARRILHMQSFRGRIAALTKHIHAHSSWLASLAGSDPPNDVT